MKKKPPPGATLIARLKEQRLAREAELARRQAEANGTAPAAATDTVDTPAPVEVAPEAVPVTESTPEVVEPKPETRAVTATKPKKEPEPVEVTLMEPTPVRQEIVVHAVSSGNGNATDLLHRQIEMNDLQPTTDDYAVLTEEIRLAGRFAAVGLIAQGLRLARLKHAELYKDHYPTFEEYCRKEHQMSATYAYRLIRMSEMAERMAEIGRPAVTSNSDAMPDPFEVMLSLGHRHLMALLPLEPEAAQELLVRGIPVTEGDQPGDQRVPISRATEKQIRDALKGFVAEPGTTKVVPKKALATEKQLIPALNKLVEMLEDWALWLGGDAPQELQAARMGRGQLLNRLAKRFRTASGKIADALEGEDAQ
jgi:hypothetical protein